MAWALQRLRFQERGATRAGLLALALAGGGMAMFQSFAFVDLMQARERVETVRVLETEPGMTCPLTHAAEACESRAPTARVTLLGKATMVTLTDVQLEEARSVGMLKISYQLGRLSGWAYIEGVVDDDERN